jgi:tetratricopeptide (TPR) repeat protein
MEILGEFRSKAHARKTWIARPVAWVTAAILVAVLALYAGFRLKTGNGSQTSKVYSPVVLNLEPYSNSRAPAEGQQSPPGFRLGRRPIELHLELPVGSEEGAYKLALISDEKSVWSTSGPARLVDHKLSLDVKADFSQVPAGQYTLRVESTAGTEINAPVILQSEPTAQTKSMRWQITWALLDRAMLTRNWFSGNRHHSDPTTGNDPEKMMITADHYSWLGNWAVAGPLYARAETLFRSRGDARDEIHCRVGRIRGNAETMPFSKVSSMLEEELENPIVQSDPRLKLWCLTAKGYTDLDLDPVSSRKEWEEARTVADSLGDKAREARASGELGIISFLEGNGAAAKKLVGDAFFSAVVNGDVGAQVRYLSMFGNALNELKRPEEASEYFNRALVLANHTPDIGFPFMAYEGKAQALVALNKSSQAELLLKDALGKAKQFSRRGHESQLYIDLGRAARERGDQESAIAYFREASNLARGAQFYRMDADAMFELANVYRSQNKLEVAEACLQQGITASRTIADRFYLPRDLAALAEVKNLQGDPRAAESLYAQATDVLDGLLVNSASSNAKSSIVAAMSDIYVRDFALAARLRKLSEAFEIVERARGRSAADLLRSTRSSNTTPNETPVDRQITNLQLRLLHSVSLTERQQILADLFDTEQKRALEAGSPRRSLVHPVSLSQLRRVLRPDELFLEYVVSDSSSYCLVVSRQSANLIRLNATRNALDRAVHSYLHQVRTKQSAEAEEHDLYSTLFGGIGAVHDNLRLVVVPDGPLNLVPFDALRASDGKYVLASHVVSYVPSGTVLYLLRTAHREFNSKLPFLGVGDVYYDASHQLLAKNTAASEPAEVERGIYDLAGARFPELPGTREEVLSAKKVFGLGSQGNLKAPVVRKFNGEAVSISDGGTQCSNLRVTSDH